MSSVLHRASGGVYPEVVSGAGCWLIDANGRRYLDASGGAAVSCLGHGHPAVIEAIRDQIGRIAYTHSSFFTNAPMEELAARLVRDSPEGLTKVYFVSDGSEAVEAALKLARQYHVERGDTGRTRLVSRRQSYHGNTLGALAIGGNLARRESYAPLLIETHHVSPCFAYRHARKGETATDYAARLVGELEETLQAVGPHTVMAFIAETVVGATSGAVPPVAGYFRAVREICDRHGILLILDEVMCGMGRTGTLHACEQEGVAPDLLTIAKGLSAGYQPLGAVLLSHRIDDAIASGSGAFQHGHTFNGHAVACRAALAVQDVIETEGLVERVRVRGRYLRDALEARFGLHPHIGDIRGRGLLQAIELVSDRATDEPFAPGLKLHARIKAEAMNQGLCVYPGGGTIDGKRGDHVLLAPSYTVSTDEIDQVVDRLTNTLQIALPAT